MINKNYLIMELECNKRVFARKFEWEDEEEMLSMIPNVFKTWQKNVEEIIRGRYNDKTRNEGSKKGE